MKLTAATVLWLLWVAGSAAAGAPVPHDAQEVIRTISSAAARADFAAFDKLMVREFTWSFGGNRDARQALDARRMTYFVAGD